MRFLRRRKQGFTLIELTVYSALFGVLLSAVYAVFALSMRYFSVARAATDLQSQAQQTVLHVVAEVADTTGASIIYSNSASSTGIIFLSPRDRLGNFQQDSSGNLLWQKWICYRWTASSGNLTRKTVDLTNPTVVPPANTYTLATFPAAGAQVVANSMTGLTFSGTDSVTIKATFQQTVFSNASGTSDNRVDIVDQIKFRN